MPVIALLYHCAYLTGLTDHEFERYSSKQRKYLSYTFSQHSRVAGTRSVARRRRVRYTFAAAVYWTFVDQLTVVRTSSDADGSACWGQGHAVGVGGP